MKIFLLFFVLIFSLTVPLYAASPSGALQPEPDSSLLAVAVSSTATLTRAINRTLKRLEASEAQGVYRTKLEEINNKVQSKRGLSQHGRESMRFSLVDSWLSAQTSSTAAILAELAAKAGKSWYTEVAKPAANAAPAEMNVQDLINAILPADAQKWGTQTWAEVKTTPQIAAFNAYRAKYVRGITYEVRERGYNGVYGSVPANPCPFCVVRGVGSADPASDIDLAAAGWGANLFVRAFNGMFEQKWPTGKTAAEVFDVNVYADCWNWPKTAYTNSKSEDSKGEQINLLLRGNPPQPVTPLCYSEKLVGAEQQLIVGVDVGAQSFLLDEQNQRRWGLSKVFLFIMEDVAKTVPPPPASCSYSFNEATLLNCPTVQAFAADAIAQLAAKSANAGTTFQEDWRQAIAQVVKLVQDPCAAGVQEDDPAIRKCFPPVNGVPNVVGKPFLNLNNIKFRNRLNFDALDEVYKKIDPTPENRQALAAPNSNYCHDVKQKLSKSAFYAQEAYLCQGTVHHIVHEGQSKLAIAWISRAQYFNSMLENFGDFVKEYAHRTRPATAPTTNKFIIKSSKYVTRLIDAAHRIEKAGGAVALNANLQSFSKCIYAPNWVLQKQVRNKEPTDAIKQAADCSIRQILECTKTLRKANNRNAPESINLDEYALDILSLYTDSLVHYYASYTPGELSAGRQNIEEVLPKSTCAIVEAPAANKKA